MKIIASVHKICEKFRLNPSLGTSYSNLFQPKT